MNPTTNAHILLVEDEPDIADLIQMRLMKAGFDVTQALNGKIALEQAEAQQFDLIVLDLMIPKIDGMEVFRRLRSQVKTKGIPVIMLTAKGQASDRVAGLEAGADDYMTKPFSPKELILRIQKQLAFVQKTKQSHIIEIAGMSFDKVKLTFTYRGEQIGLTTTEFKLLLYLCESPNQLHSRAVLLKEVWGYSEEVTSRTLDTHVKRIRMKLDDLADSIKTIRGKGYVFEVTDESE